MNYLKNINLEKEILSEKYWKTLQQGHNDK